MIVGNLNVSKVLEVVRVIFIRAIDDHLSMGVVTVYSGVGFPPGFTLRFFCTENCDDDLVDIDDPLPI